MDIVKQMVLVMRYLFEKEEEDDGEEETRRQRQRRGREGEDSIKEPSSPDNDLMSEARNVFVQRDCVMRR